MPRIATTKPTVPELPTETLTQTVVPTAEEPARDEVANPEATIAPNDVDQASKTEPEETEEPIVKSGCKKIKVKDFRGSFGRAKFDDDGICEAIDEETFNQLRKQFPGAEYEFLD
ncbi:MAG: hypothetical protein JSS81_18135 [Acidobacteria bacterium]|nr:hypothetical protein [Acidobacteriota bacterium]